MKSKSTISVSIITLLMCSLCACTEDSDKSATDELLAGTGISAEDFGDLATTSGSVPSSASVEGIWRQDFGDGFFDQYRFETGGAGVHEGNSYDDGAFTNGLDWTVEEAMLTVAIDETERVSDSGTCTVSESWTVSTAIVDDVLYRNVFIRTSGSGDSLDGVWENFNGEMESYDCGDGTESLSGFQSQIVHISGNSFTADTHWENVYLINGQVYTDPEDPDDAGGDITNSGSIETTGMVSVFFDETDPDFSWVDMARIGENVLLQVHLEEFDTIEEAMTEFALIRQ